MNQQPVNPEYEACKEYIAHFVARRFGSIGAEIIRRMGVSTAFIGRIAAHEDISETV